MGAVDDARAQRVADEVAAMLHVLALQAPEVAVRLTSDAEVRALNGTWRGKDSATDVLSFPQQDPPVEGGLLGDLVVGLGVAEAQAEALGHSLEQELRVLLAHGLAHLVGHDHQTDEETLAMRAVEARLLAAHGAEGLIARAHDG